MPILKITNDKTEFEVKDGEAFLDICDRHTTCIPFGCMAGACGTCRIRVKENPENLNPKSELETEFLRDFMPDSGNNVRLACQCQVKGDITIEVVDPA